MRFYNPFHQIQTQARAVDLIFERALTAIERIKDAGLFLRGNSGTAIGDANLHGWTILVVYRRRENADPTVLFRAILQRVVHQVLKSVRHRQLVGEYQRKTGLELPLHDHGGPLVCLLTGAQGLVNQGIELDRLACADNVTRSGAGKSENVLHQVRQFRAFVLDEFSITLHLFGLSSQFIPKVKCGRADHSERRPQLV